MKKLLNGILYVIASLVSIPLVIFFALSMLVVYIVVCYIVNIGRIIDSDSVGYEESVRLIGVVLFPLGIVQGFSDVCANIEQENI